MKTHTNPQLERLLYKIRNPNTGSEDFRSSLEKIGEYIGLEIANYLEVESVKIKTSLGRDVEHILLRESPALVTVLRAGIPLYNGLQKAFPESETGFIGAMRDERTLKSKISYCALPNIRDKIVILTDTMLATGGSLIDCAELIKQLSPRRIILASAIASQQGIKRINEYDGTIKVYTAAIDPELNENGYIVPGRGDAGDRCFGEKIDKL
ncbi:MAG: uracil phosphoribosyltransferase [archaeon]